jgi:NhaP-type Na+/H+ or K+/H+ antiporter
MEHFVTTIALTGIVIVVASLLSGALERSGLPLVAVFLALGAALGPWGLGFVDIGLGSPELRILATLGLTLVLFSDAVTINIKDVWARRRLAWRLLGPGTLAPALVVALAAAWLLHLSAAAALLLGAALASTDPVLLRSVLRSKTIPPTARLALRLETGMNDVVLLPIVAICMLFLRPGAAGPGMPEVARHLVGLFLLGPALGAAVGWLGITMLDRVRGSRVGVRRDYESLYALGLAFSGYAAAEAVGGSGFLAAFAAGFVIASQDVELCDCFLEYGEATAEMFLLLTFVAFGTTLIWKGLAAIDGPTLAFAAIALAARTVLLLPILGGKGVGIGLRDRRIIALFGPRGLSSLLFTLLPVLAGVPGAERLFTISCLVVLLSVLLHGGGIALYLRANCDKGPGGKEATAPAGAAAPFPLSQGLGLRKPASGEEAAPVASGEEEGTAVPVSDRIEIGEMGELVASGRPHIVLDVRSERSYEGAETQAEGSVRLPPDDAVRAARALNLPRDVPLLAYCA